MICKNCGTQVPEDKSFCPVCGSAVVAETLDEEENNIIEESLSEVEQNNNEVIPSSQVEYVWQNSEPVKKSFKKKPLIIAGATLAIILIAAIVIVPIVMNSIKQTKYDQAVELLRRTDYAGAKMLFTELGGFKDAPEKVEYCQNKVKYDKALALLEDGNYAEAKVLFTELGKFEDASERVEYCQNKEKYEEAADLLEKGEYADAKVLFSELGTFEDASDQAIYCQNIIDYDKAEDLLVQKKYSDAVKAFKLLGDFRDSNKKAKHCEDWIAYLQAEELLKAEDYSAAKALYANLPADSFPEASKKYTLCVNKDAYKAAEALYAEGAYYAAYLAFEKLGSFEDANQRMAECVQPFPSTGEVYRNQDYSGSDLSLTIVTPANDESRNYLKIYTQDDVLVSCLAIEQGAIGEVLLPQGSYRIKNSYGSGDWFGETDMFGDDGIYLVLKNGVGDNELFNLESGYTYTLTLRSEDDTIGDPVNSESENRDKF